MAACLCEVLNSLLNFAVRHEFTKKHLLYLLKNLQKAHFSPSFGSDLLFCILIKEIIQFFFRQLIVVFINFSNI